MNRSFTSCAAGALLLLSRIAAAQADDFGAMPGLWKTTYSLEPGSAGTKPPLQWHCVDEEADPWQAFAQLDAHAPACKSATYERTVSSLKWHRACGAGPSEGSLVFDSPKHYSGTITARGGKAKAPPSSLRVEGERVAACTSPSD